VPKDSKHPSKSKKCCSTKEKNSKCQPDNNTLPPVKVRSAFNLIREITTFQDDIDLLEKALGEGDGQVCGSGQPIVEVARNMKAIEGMIFQVWDFERRWVLHNCLVPLYIKANDMLSAIVDTRGMELMDPWSPHGICN
jgi:hypothetical protein